MQALLAQLASAPGDIERNAARAVEAIEAHPEVELAVFPELFLTGYVLDRIDELALRADAAALGQISDAARRIETVVAIGFAEARSNGVANAVALFDEGGALAGVYRKTQLFGAERHAFVAGESFLVADLAGRRVAPLVCFDVEFPEPARRVALAGANLLVTVSANMAPFYGDHELATRARALENRVPHLYANAVGSSSGDEFVGGSRSIAADGTVLAELAHADEELLVAPVGEPGADDDRVDYLQFLREPLGVVAP